jgi:UDP-N-acetylglucosamine--N-acetylmuramyl-(pentapeptide) pyrophosphoryl-undecaprenol N-acetylglucosamine transferase
MEKSIRIIQQTNENNISNLSQFYSKNNIENRIFSFEKNLSNIIQETDLCITRAGASTLAELSILSTPFIAVPLPSAKDNHQLENANYYKNNDCCWIINQNLFDEKIEEILKDILSNKRDYLNKKENLKKLNYQNTWINVNQKLLKIIYEN